MSRDPEEYPDPERLWPERFLEDKPPKDPADSVFRFGRRICFGLHFSTEISFIYFASILHVFDIRPPVDAVDVPVKFKYRPSVGVISTPGDT